MAIGSNPLRSANLASNRVSEPFPALRTLDEAAHRRLARNVLQSARWRGSLALYEGHTKSRALIAQAPTYAVSKQATSLRL
jgi:hypothetical protein